MNNVDRLSIFVASTRIVQTEEDMESDVAVCLPWYCNARLQTERTRSTNMEYNRK